MHFHAAAVNVNIWGNKRWLLTPPRFAGSSPRSGPEWAAAASQEGLPAGFPLRCTQRPGDVLILPPLWGHATANDAFSLGFGFLFDDMVTSSYQYLPDEASHNPMALVSDEYATGARDEGVDMGTQRPVVQADPMPCTSEHAKVTLAKARRARAERLAVQAEAAKAQARADQKRAAAVEAQETVTQVQLRLHNARATERKVQRKPGKQRKQGKQKRSRKAKS